VTGEGQGEGPRTISQRRKMYSHRIATPVDLDEIVAIYNSTVASRQVTADLEPVSTESRVPWFNEHTPDLRPLWVVDLDGRVAGWLSFSNFYGRPAYAKTAEISVYLHQDYRDKGLGSYFLRLAIGYAPGIGVDTLLGFIFGHNEPSLRLFRKHDFREWGRLPKVARLDGFERDLCIMGRKVP
jgi:L-amino acid N-acyltransferase YncA